MDKILFLHGLNSRPYEDRIEILKASGAEVFCPHILYDNIDSVKAAMDIVEKENITHVVGHSMGGIFAYLLSTLYSLPCLMFNPAMHKENFKYFKRVMGLDVSEWHPDTEQFAVVGMKDDVVLPEVQLSELKFATIYKEDELGHKIDPTTYKMYFDKFYALTKTTAKRNLDDYLMYLEAKFGLSIIIPKLGMNPLIERQPKGYHYCTIIYSSKPDPKGIHYGFMVSTKATWCDNIDAIKFAEELTELAIMCLKLNELTIRKNTNEGI